MQLDAAATGVTGPDEFDHEDQERANATLVTIVGLLAIALLSGAAAMFAAG